MAYRGRNNWENVMREAGESAVMGAVAVKKPGLAAGFLIAKSVMGFTIGIAVIILFIVVFTHVTPAKDTAAGQKIVQATARIKARMFKKNGAEDERY